MYIENYRFPAEWEPQWAVQLTLPHEDTDFAPILEEAEACFLNIAKAIASRQELIIACRSIEKAKKLLASCKQESIHYYEVPSNDVWARDHAPISILKRNEPCLLNFRFNGWGLKFPADKDNLLSKRLHEQGAYKTRELREMHWVLEGGSIESDGNGTLLTTTQCLLSPNRNPDYNRVQLDKRLINTFGAYRVLWLHNGHLEGDDTDAHIDTLARFCDEKTIAYVKCTDKKDSHYDALKKMEEELQAFRTKEGNPYKLIGLPMVSPIYNEEGRRLPATYANFLIINGAVLVPTYNAPEDAQALKLLKAAFPKREIVAIDCRALIKQNGSLHCVTMQYPVDFFRNHKRGRKPKNAPVNP